MDSPPLPDLALSLDSDRFDQIVLGSDDETLDSTAELEEVLEEQQRNQENVAGLQNFDATRNGDSRACVEDDAANVPNEAASEDAEAPAIGLSEETDEAWQEAAGPSPSPAVSVAKVATSAARRAGNGVFGAGTSRKTIVVQPSRNSIPSVGSKVVPSHTKKQASPFSSTNAHSSASPVTSRRSFLKSSSPAALARKAEADNGDHSPRHAGDGFAANSKVSAPVIRQRNSIGAPRTSSATPSTPTSRRASLDPWTLPPPDFANAATARSDSRRASLSGSLSSLSSRSISSAAELHKLARLPATPSSQKGPSFGKSPNLSLQSPRPSPRPPTPDSGKRSSPASSVAGATRSSAKPAVSSPRMPTTPTLYPRNRTLPSNGTTGAVMNPQRVSPEPTESIIKQNSNSLDSRNVGMATTQSRNIARRPSPPLSSEHGRRKSLTSERRDSRFVALPTVDVKAGEDVRLDLRGQKVRSLECNLVNLTAKLEFVYLRDNKLSTLTGIEILRRVKVLDLSFNEFKGAGFEPLASCKALQQLYLAGNQITSLTGLPQMLNLEFLSVAQNKLKSLTMGTQPRLQVFAASKNKISTFKGFPYLPSLENLRLEENPILELQHVEAAAILLAGPSLKKFNDKELPLEEQELARLYPPHTAICIRDGWEFCGLEDAPGSSMQFLAAQWHDGLPPGYEVEEATIDQPSEESPCFCQFTLRKQTDIHEELELNLLYQWFIGGKTPSDFIVIEGATKEVFWPKRKDVGHSLKVECTPVLGEREYPPIFAISFPVLPGSGCPKVMSLQVAGPTVEGNVIHGHAEIAWCGGTPSKGIVSWLRRYENSGPEVIVGAEEMEYLLSLEDIGANLLLMFTPVTQEGVKGEPHFGTTAVIQPGFPQVRSVQVLGDVIEGNSIKGVGNYFGGKEGMSKYEWLREDVDSGEFKLVARGTAEYTLSEEDVGLRMMFIYTPMNSEGRQGDPVSAITGRVLVAPPKVTQLSIVGDIIEGNKVAISATICGGVEGTSRVQWFKTNTPDESLGDTNLEVISTSKISKDFRIPVEAVGFYLAAKYTPVRADGETGEPAMIFSSTPVEMLPPSLNFLSITGEFIEGETLTASYGYSGGHEGTSEYSWYLHENERDLGTLILESAGLQQYQITKKAVNKFVSFKCVPFRDDGCIGEAKVAMGQERIRPGSPKLLSLRIFGNPIEGSELQAEKTYWGGVEGPSKLQWFLTGPDGTQREIKGATTLTYTCCTEDIDGLLCVSCEPIRLDGAKGPVKVSQPTEPVLPAPPTCEFLELCGEAVEGAWLGFNAVYRGGEKGACTCVWIRQGTDGVEQKRSSCETLYLTAEDVGCCIELVYTPVRKDGVTGIPKRILSDVVKDADPVGVSLKIPDCCQDVEVGPQKSYFGGSEGHSEFTWFRLQNSMEGLEVPDDAHIVGKSKTYIPNLEDVGTYLVLRWIPVREDGKKGKACIACSSHAVAAAPPSVHNVTVEEVSPETFRGEGIYYGGLEGKSQMSWYRQAVDGTVTLIAGATSKTYVVMEDDYTCSLIFGYTPVRKDAAIGRLVLSEPSTTIFPELPKVQKLVLTGKAVEGEVLTALEVMPKSEKQQHIWEKYKKDVKYQWSRSWGQGMVSKFEELPLQRGCSYKVQSEDVGFTLCLECVVTDIFGRLASPVSVVTPTIAPGIPKVNKLEIEGQGYHTNIYAVRGIYSGGKEGKSIIQWFRAMAGSPDLIPIAGEVGRMYEANVDDVGYRLVAVYTPVREDGLEGAPASASTEPISVEPECAKEVKQKLELGAVKFEALRDRDCSPIKAQQQQGLGSLERRVLEVNRKRLKVVRPGSKTSFPSTEIRGTYAPPFHVDVFRNDQHRFKLVIDTENEIDLMVQTRHTRDVIVLVIRGLAQRYNSMPLNLLLKI